MRSDEEIRVLIPDDPIEGVFSPPKEALRGPLEDDPPSGSVSLVKFRRKARRLALSLAEMFGTKIDGPVVLDIAGAYLQAAGLSSRSRPGVEAIIRRKAGECLCAENALSIGCLVEYYKNLLDRGFTIPRWQPNSPCWSASDILDMEKDDRAKGGLRMIVDVYHWTGMLAGTASKYNLSAKWLSWLARDIGAGRRHPAAARDLVGMEAWLVPGLLPTGKLGLLKASADDAMKGRNRKLFKGRWDKNCKFITIPCSECKRGRDRCPLACRRVTEVIDGREANE